MEGMVAAKKKSGMVENQMIQDVSRRLATTDSPQQWRRELKFLKSKYALLKRLLDLSYTHCRSAKQEQEWENLRQECALFISSMLADFEDQLNENADLLEYLELLPDSSSDVIRRQFHALERAWNDLQKEHRRLEIRLLNALIKRYPVIIF